MSRLHRFKCEICGKTEVRIVAKFYHYPEEGYSEEECRTHNNRVDREFENASYRNKTIICSDCSRNASDSFIDKTLRGGGNNG